MRRRRQTCVRSVSVSPGSVEEEEEGCFVGVDD